MGSERVGTTEQLTLSHFGSWREVASRLDCVCGSTCFRAELRAVLTQGQDRDPVMGVAPGPGPWFGPLSASALSSCSWLGASWGLRTPRRLGKTQPLSLGEKRCVREGFQEEELGSHARCSGCHGAPEPVPGAVTSCSTCQVMTQFLPSPRWAPGGDRTVCGRESLTGPSGGRRTDAPGVLHTHVCSWRHEPQRAESNCPLTREELNSACPGRAGGASLTEEGGSDTGCAPESRGRDAGGDKPAARGHVPSDSVHMKYLRRSDSQKHSKRLLPGAWREGQMEEKCLQGAKCQFVV